MPTVNAQLSFNRLSQNDLQSHLDYLESVRNHHKQVREYFYPFIFRNAKTDEVDWQNLPKHKFDDEKKTTQFPNSVCAILAFSILLGGLAWRKLNILLA
ncbi:MAG: DUF3526 domain-containing protein [Blastocatellia bacterium]|nr:DUF3526 domain-containing protein [Blastocatellia bacterium]